MNSFAKDRNLSSNFPNSVFDALASEVAFETMPVPVAEKTIGNKNKLVCKMVNPKTFDRIENTAGYQIFYGELARANLRTIRLLDDVLFYGKNSVNSGVSSGSWQLDGWYADVRVTCGFYGLCHHRWSNSTRQVELLWRCR